MSAKLGALSAETSFLIGLDPNRGVISGDEVALAVAVWCPEAVDHVSRGAVDDDGHADGYMYLVRGGHGLIWLGVRVRHFPPPLMSDDLDADGVLRLERLRVPLARFDALHQNNEEKNHG